MELMYSRGMLPSNLNNAIRALMKNTRDWFNDAQWVEYGDGDGAFKFIIFYKHNSQCYLG
jgi:hypothetical protein